MEENVRENKMGRNIAIIMIIVVIALLTVVYLLFGLKRYMDANPQITPYENVTCRVGETLSIEKLVKIEKVKEAKILGISEDTREQTDAKITEDKQAVYAGSQPGTFQVSVMATGSNHESREAQIYVTVEE